MIFRRYQWGAVRNRHPDQGPKPTPTHCQLIWMILYKGVRYEERGPAVCEQSKRVRTVRMIRTLRKLGYRVELQADPA